MITKGVASVRSPVQNLQSFDSSISHDSFVNAAVNVFKEKYDIHEEVCTTHACVLMGSHRAYLKIHYVEENENTLSIPAIRAGMDELKVRLTLSMQCS